MSHIALTYHIVFGTFKREATIFEQYEKALYKYLYDYATLHGVYVRRIGGMPDHIHILCDIPPKIAVATFVRTVKAETSKFLRDNPLFTHWQGWASGYACFTVDASLVETRRQYIIHQKEHHKHTGFSQEYDNLLTEAGLSEDAPSVHNI